MHKVVHPVRKEVVSFFGQNGNIEIRSGCRDSASWGQETWHLFFFLTYCFQDLVQVMNGQFYTITSIFFCRRIN